MSDEYDGGLSEALAELKSLSAAEGGEPPVGRGEGAEGMIVVTATNGRVSTVELNPRVMRLASQELAEEFARAANAALTDLESKYPALPLGNIDPRALETQLTEAREQGLRQMRRYDESITDALRQIGG